MDMRKILAAFDEHLTRQGLRLDGVLLGGAALQLLGVITRPTRDCDILVPDLPQEILDTARRFARDTRVGGAVLQDDWLNNGPAALAHILPVGWRERLQPGFQGSVLVLKCLGRSDLLCSKLFALCDRGLDLADCVALQPTPDEIARILPWLVRQDAHPDWPAHVNLTLQDLARRSRHGL